MGPNRRIKVGTRIHGHTSTGQSLAHQVTSYFLNIIKLTLFQRPLCFDICIQYIYIHTYTHQACWLVPSCFGPWLAFSHRLDSLRRRWRERERYDVCKFLSTPIRCWKTCHVHQSSFRLQVRSFKVPWRNPNKTCARQSGRTAQRGGANGGTVFGEKKRLRKPHWKP